MSDPRPRPKYGEYAPEGWVSPVAVEAVEVPPVGPSVPLPPPPGVAPARRSWDLVLTVGLLAFGLYSVVSGYLTNSDLPALFDKAYELQGIGDFTSDALARSVGTVINIVQTVIWLVVAALAVRALRRGRTAFYWPLAGGVLATLIAAVLMGIVMVTDPAFTAYAQQMAP